MKVVSPGGVRKVESNETREKEGPRARPAYQAPRIVKKRPVSKATLFTGSGPDAGGIFGSD